MASNCMLQSGVLFIHEACKNAHALIIAIANTARSRETSSPECVYQDEMPCQANKWHSTNMRNLAPEVQSSQAGIT